VIAGCLALNSSFEPLTMVPLRRALRLVIDGKAEIVEADRELLVRSERLAYPRPIVIRLTKYIHVPRRFRRQVTNTFLFARDRYSCQYCGRTASALRPREALTPDPGLPLSRGGPNRFRSGRTVTALTVGGVEETIRLEVEADGFLYNMVRTCTGTLVNVGRGTWTPDDVERILKAQNRMQAGDTCPACGLYLVEVHYPDNEDEL